MGSSSSRSIDRDLFNAWRSQDPDARQKAWECLWQELHARAVSFCRRLLGSASDAESCALDALQDTIEELQTELNSGSLQWRGEPRFAAFVARKLRWRCKDVVRKRLRELSRAEDLLEQEPPTRESESDPQCIVVDALGSEALITHLLLTAQELEGQPALEATLRAVVGYLAELAEESGGEIDIDRCGLYAYLRRTLRINQNALYVRMSRLRQVIGVL